MHYDELSTDCVIFVSVKYVLDSVLRSVQIISSN